MRVKRLEVQGFKSFKDKTTIHFDHGITGIVGPNGCGKSNIVDAFFWVMGEQSYKHMRGTGAEDLIFSGSSKYAPLGLAEATLVMETEEVDLENAPAGASAADAPLPMRKKEVSVTRRVYRSGEGEYFINGQPARLKDIHELFMDTGVGAKGYSVIEQGQIGKVVNAKPEDRRLLIEEAAGIAKYKARKKESLRKVESAQGNLARLTDVLQEIERSLDSLERQAQKARRYQEYQKELFEKEVTWGRRRTKVLRQQADAIRAERDALEQELVGFKAEFQTAENTIETERVIQATESRRVDDLQTAIQAVASDLTHEQSALELSRKRQEDLRVQLQGLESEKSELAQSIEAEKERLAERLTESETLAIDQETAREKASALEEQVRELRSQVQALRSQLDGARRELMDGSSQASEFTARKSLLDGKIQSAEDLQVKVQEKVVEIQDETSELQSRLSALETKQISVAQELDSVKNAVESERQVLLALESREDAAEEAREASKTQLTQLQSKLESLEELSAALEGVGDGPKAILEWARSNGKSEQLRFLADAIQIAPGYELAVEGYLESKLELIIAGDLSLSLESLRQIREAKSGRAAIAQLGSLPQYSVASDRYTELNSAQFALSQSGVECLGLLSQFIKIQDASVADWINDSLLRRVMVVKDFDRSLDRLKALQERDAQGWSFVSVDGFVLDADGTLRGGSTESEQSGSLLGRKRLMQEIAAQLEAACARADSARLSFDAAQQSVQEQESKIDALESRALELQYQAESNVREIEQASERIESVVSESRDLQEEVREAKRIVEESRAEQARIDQESERIFARRRELEAMLSQNDRHLTDLVSTLQAREALLQECKIEEASTRERIQGAKREIETARAFIVSRESRAQEIQRLLDRMQDERQSFTGGEEGLESRIRQLAQDLADRQAELSEVKNRLETSNASLSRRLDQLKTLNADIERKSARVNALAVEAEKASGELSFVVRNLEEKHGAGCLDQVSEQSEMDAPIVTREMTEEEERQLFDEVEALKRKMQNLGSVNPAAIEEFEATQQRYEHLKSEKLDLEKSIEDLNAAIEHINKTSEERFSKAFEAIADRFERLFPIIFGGGQARMSLVYPEGSTDILEAGVDILAQPPGKKIQNMTLLSGGEKALTAISLIFAIFMVKPSPFCVLDEVDAPLDDSNIGKFNGVLREMSSKSQFIVITHNKKTMELNDALYGVTMEEPGVSKIVSVELG